MRKSWNEVFNELPHENKDEMQGIFVYALICLAIIVVNIASR